MYRYFIGSMGDFILFKNQCGIIIIMLFYRVFLRLGQNHGPLEISIGQISVLILFFFYMCFKKSCAPKRKLRDILPPGCRLKISEK